jgi:hypothetical protein
MALPPPVNLPLPAPSNRITEYQVDVTSSSNLGSINHRILITRVGPINPPQTFEMLLTDEQWAVWRQLFNPY